MRATGVKRAAISAVAALTAACGGGAPVPGDSGVVERDSAGVTIIENGALDRTRSLLAHPEPVLRIGVLEGAAAYQLFQVSDVKRLSDGAVAVANGGSRDVRIYEPDGTHRVTVGGAGEGPSEFRYPRALTILPGDTIEVVDFLDRVYFAPDGVFLRRETTSPQALSRVWQAIGGWSEGGEWLPDGTLFAPVYRRDDRRGPPQPGPLFRPEMTLVRLSPDFSTVDSLGDYGGIEQQYVDMGGERGVSAIVPPYFKQTVWALGSADGTIVVGDNAAPRIDRFHPDGSRSIVRWSAAPEPVDEADVEAWKDRQRAAEWTRGQLPELERGWAAMDIPETKAYYGRVFAGSDGRVWAGPVDPLAGSTTLLGFDARGHYLGTVEVPDRFVPYDSGPGWLLGVTQGEADVEYVHMYELATR